MAREVLSNEELAALNAAASQQARPGGVLAVENPHLLLTICRRGYLHRVLPRLRGPLVVTRHRGRSGKPLFYCRLGR
jgi:hypothetical protein